MVLWLLFGLVFLGAATYVGLCAVAADKVPAGATVDGVPIGGLRAAAAEERLRLQLGPRSRQPIRISGGGVTTTLDPAAAGLSLDVPGSVRAAGGGRDFRPARLWAYFTGGEPIDAQVAVDRSRLDAAVEDLATRVDAQPVDGAVTFTEGRAVRTAAVDGQRLSRGGTRESIIRAYLGNEPAELRVDVLRPAISDVAVDEAMTSFARPATAAPIRLVLARHEVKVPPRLYAPAISLTPDGGRLAPTLDIDALVAALRPVSATVPGRPVPARIVVSRGRARVVPSRAGITFDRSDLARTFLAAVARPAGQRRVPVLGATAHADFTTADARRLKVTQRVATFSTRFAFADYRNVNLARGAALLDGTLLRPGQTFSFNRTVGRPSRARGFVKGYVISGGVFTEDAGGGLSQLATTLYNASFFAGLEDVRHEVHSVYSPRFPKGREATVDYGRSDLRFRNDSPYGVLVTAHVTPSTRASDGTVTVSLWSTRRWDVTTRTGTEFHRRQPAVRHRRGASCEAAVGYPGFSVHVYRVFHRPGQQRPVRTERTTAVYEPSDTVVCDTP